MLDHHIERNELCENHLLHSTCAVTELLYQLNHDNEQVLDVKYLVQQFGDLYM